MIYISDHIFLILPFIQDRASIHWVLKSSHLYGEKKKKIVKWFARTSWQIIGAGGIRTQDRPHWLNIITGPWEFWMCRRINANSLWVFSPLFSFSLLRLAFSLGILLCSIMNFPVIWKKLSEGISTIW